MYRFLLAGLIIIFSTTALAAPAKLLLFTDPSRLMANGETMHRIGYLLKRLKGKVFPDDLSVTLYVEGSVNPAKFVQINEIDLPAVSDHQTGLYGPVWKQYFTSADGPVAVLLDENGSVIKRFTHWMFLPEYIQEYFEDIVPDSAKAS